MKKLGWIGKLQYNIYYHLVGKTFKKKVKEMWKSMSLPPFCCSTCIQTIIFRYNCDITAGFFCSLYFANQINLSVKTSKVCLAYPDILGSRMLESYFASLSLWSLQKNIKLIFFKRKGKAQVYSFCLFACWKFGIVLSVKLWSNSDHLKTQNTLSVICHQSTEAQSTIRWERLNAISIRSHKS